MVTLGKVRTNLRRVGSFVLSPIRNLYHSYHTNAGFRNPLKASRKGLTINPHTSHQEHQMGSDRELRKVVLVARKVEEIKKTGAVRILDMKALGICDQDTIEQIWGPGVSEDSQMDTTLFYKKLHNLKRDGIRNMDRFDFSKLSSSKH